MVDQVNGSAFGFDSGASYQDRAPKEGRGARDQHFMQADDKSGRTDVWTAGTNSFMVLPPFSNYIQRYTEIRDQAAKDGKPPLYPIGHVYYRLNIRTGNSPRPLAYRVPRDNAINQAFKTLYNGLCGGSGPFTDELRKIADHLTGKPKHGFSPDCRFVLNILLANHLSDIKWFDAPFDEYPPEDEKASKRVGNRITELFSQYTRLTPRQLPLFDLDETVPLNMSVTITYAQQKKREQAIPNWGDVEPIKNPDGQLYVTSGRTILEQNVQNWCEEMLDELENWAKTYDDLPDLKDVPNLAANGRACELLGISTAAAHPDSDYSPGFTPPAQPQSQPPEQPQGQPSAQPQSQPAFGAAGAQGQPPAQPQGQPEGGVGSVGSAFSSFDQKGMEAAAAFRKEVEGASPGSEGESTGAAEAEKTESPPVVNDEPPF